MLMPIIKRRRPRSYSADWVRRDEVRKDREVLADRRASATLLMLLHQVHGEPRFDLPRTLEGGARRGAPPRCQCNR
jgi:hypothetical protein